jgi:hypothetical protein
MPPARHHLWFRSKQHGYRAWEEDGDAAIATKVLAQFTSYNTLYYPSAPTEMSGDLGPANNAGVVRALPVITHMPEKFQTSTSGTFRRRKQVPSCLHARSTDDRGQAFQG